MRDRLKGLLNNTFEAQYEMRGLLTAEHTADHLIANGVIVPPCKVGDTVWVVNHHTGGVYEQVVVCIKTRAMSKYKNTIRTEYHNTRGESSYRKFTWAMFGKTVFLNREDAERVLEEVNDDKA